MASVNTLFPGALDSEDPQFLVRTLSPSVLPSFSPYPHPLPKASCSSSASSSQSYLSLSTGWHTNISEKREVNTRYPISTLPGLALAHSEFSRALCYVEYFPVGSQEVRKWGLINSQGSISPGMSLDQPAWVISPPGCWLIVQILGPHTKGCVLASSPCFWQASISIGLGTDTLFYFLWVFFLLFGGCWGPLICSRQLCWAAEGHQ